MTEKFGPNGDQLAKFLEVARSLKFVWVAPVVEETRSKAVRDARDATKGAGFSAARYSAASSASRKLIKDLRASFPKTATTEERFTLNRFTSMLTAAVFAFASRPFVEDEAVAVVVDPFTSRLGFEWRYWGVGLNGSAGDDRG